MGGYESKIEDKDIVDSNGHVNNNIVIQEATDIHDQVSINRQLLMLTYVLVFLKSIELIIYCYNSYTRKLKKKYKTSNESTC